MVPDRLRQRLPGLAGDLAPLSLSRGSSRRTCAGRSSAPRRKRRDAQEPRLGAVLRSRGARPAVSRQAASVTPRSRGSDLAAEQFEEFCAQAPRAPRRGRVRVLRHRRGARSGAQESRRRSIPRTRSISSPSCSSVASRSGASRKAGRATWPSSHKQNWSWSTQRLPEPARVARWGHFGTPVLLFPTAGGDYEEIERFHLVRVLGDLIEAGRIKVYSVDSVAGKTWLQGTHSAEYCSRVQNLFDGYIYHEVVPLIRKDCSQQRHRGRSRPAPRSARSTRWRASAAIPTSSSSRSR